jgi:hypothetical protein
VTAPNGDDEQAMSLRESTYSDDETIHVEERLRGLGYIE